MQASLDLINRLLVLHAYALRHEHESVGGCFACDQREAVSVARRELAALTACKRKWDIVRDGRELFVVRFDMRDQRRFRELGFALTHVSVEGNGAPVLGIERVFAKRISSIAAKQARLKLTSHDEMDSLAAEVGKQILAMAGVHYTIGEDLPTQPADEEVKR